MPRRHAEWMKPVDDRILEVLYEEDRPMSSSTIHTRLKGHSSQLQFSNWYTAARLDRLLFYGLITTESDSWRFMLSQQGLAYLRNTLDMSTVSPSTETSAGNDPPEPTWTGIDRID